MSSIVMANNVMKRTSRFKSERISREEFSIIDGMTAQLQMVFGILLTAGVVLGRWI